MSLPLISPVDFPINSQAVVSTTTEHPQNLYRIAVAEAGTLTLQTFKAINVVLDTSLDLYDATGTLVSSNDDNGTSYFSLISFAVTAGNYYVRAGHFAPTGFAGVFGFKASLVTATNPTPVITDLGTLPAPASAFSFTQADIDAAIATALRVISVGTSSIVGVVKVGLMPVGNKKVRLYRKDNGLLVSETISDSLGNYAFNNLPSSMEFFVVSHDDSGVYNAAISDNIIS